MTTPEEYKKDWDKNIEDLCRHLCVVKGEDPDELWDNNFPFWQIYIGDAEDYLRRREFNRHYWTDICEHRD